jgi:hypothetical protein
VIAFAPIDDERAIKQAYAARLKIVRRETMRPAFSACEKLVDALI